MFCVATGEVGRRIGEALALARMTDGDLREALRKRGIEIGYQHIGNWKKGRNDPRRELVPAIAESIGITPEALEGRAPMHVLREAKSSFGLLTPVPMQMGVIRVVGSVGAGAPAVSELDETIEVPLAMARPDWRGHVLPDTADSMFPFLRPRDVATFKPQPVPKLYYPNLIYADEWVDHGNDGGLRVKMVIARGSELFLHSLNPKYKDEPMHGQVLGYLTGWFRIDGSRVSYDADPNGLRPDEFLEFFYTNR